MTVQILDDVRQKAEELYPMPKPKYIPDDYYNEEFTDRYMEMQLLQSTFIAGYSLSQQKLLSFREKLKNITVDELFKNPKIVIELFDEEFGIVN